MDLESTTNSDIWANDQELTYPNCLDGSRLVHRSISLIGTSKRGEMTPHLFNLPVRLTTILPALWSSTISNSPMYPCFIITVKNLTITFEQGRISTCLLPRFSALWIDFRASLNTFIRTMAEITIDFIYTLRENRITLRLHWKMSKHERGYARWTLLLVEIAFVTSYM